MENVTNLTAAAIERFYRLISSQLVVVSLLILLCIVYLVPKILETWLSNVLSRHLPCDLTVQRFGFIFAEGVAVRFINGEIVYIRTVLFTSSLFNSSVSSLIVVCVDRVEFQTTHGGLYDIVQAIRRKNERFYPRKKREERDTWSSLFVGSLSKFLSVVVRDVRVGLWPSLQLAKVNSSWLNWNSSTRSAADKPQRTSGKSSPHIRESDLSEEKMNINYLDWATNSKLATVLMLTSIRITFHCTQDCIRVRLHSSRICGKLLSTSGDAGCQFDDREDEDDNDSVNNVEEEGVYVCETEGQARGSFARGGGMLLSHTRLYSHVELVYYRCVKPNLGPGHRRVRDEECRWKLKSTCIQLYGVRLSLMEELLELLKQRLNIPEHGPSAVSGMAFSPPLRSASFHQSRASDSFTAKAVALHSPCGTTSSRDRVSSTVGSSTKLHICLSILPLRQMTNSRSGGSQNPDCEVEDIGLRFELIRSVFRRSLQLKFQTLLITGVLTHPRRRAPTPTPSRSGSFSSNTSDGIRSPHYAASGSASLNELPSARHHFCPTAKMFSSPELDHCAADDAVYTWSFPASSSDLDVDSDSMKNARRTESSTLPESTFWVRIKLNQLRLINGWDDIRNVCALDCRLNSVVLDACRRTTDCFLNGTIGTSRLMCIHSPVELHFFTELIDIIMATCSWLAEQRSHTLFRLGSVPLDRRRFSSVPVWPSASGTTASTEQHKIWCPSHEQSSIGAETWSLSRRLISQTQRATSSCMPVPISFPSVPRTVTDTELNSFGWFRLAHHCRFVVHLRVGNSASGSALGSQQVTMWPGFRSHACDRYWSRFEDANADAFVDPLSTDLRRSESQVDSKKPEIHILISSDSCALGLQLGLDCFVFDYNCPTFDPSMSVLLQSDANLTLYALHLTTLDMHKLRGLCWTSVLIASASALSPDNLESWLASLRLESSLVSCPSPSAILDRRSDSHVLDCLTESFTILPSEHHRGQVFSLLRCLVRFHNRRLMYSVDGVQICWPNAELLQLATWWSSTQSSVSCTCALSTESIASSSPIQLITTHYVTQQDNQPQMNLPANNAFCLTPVLIEGQVDELNAFVVCQNGGIVVALRIESFRSSSTVQCTAPPSGSQAVNLPLLSSTGQHLDTNTVTVADGQPLPVFLEHEQSSITLTAAKMTYLPKVQTENSGQYKAKSGDSTEELQRQLFWLPELTVEIINMDKLVNVCCPQPMEFLWTPALHLSLLESFRTFQQLSSLCFRTIEQQDQRSSALHTNYSTVRGAPTSSSGPNQTLSQRYITWMIRFTATKSVQIFVHLASEAHQLAFCLKTLSFRLSLNSATEYPTEPPEFTTRASTTTGHTVSPSQIKLSFESALIRFDSENIAVFKQLTVRRRLFACHHRTDYNKLGLMRKCNTAWEFDADLVYFTFPYRYCFRESYQELTAIVKLIRILSISSDEDVPAGGISHESVRTPTTLQSRATINRLSSVKRHEVLTVLPEEDSSDHGDAIALGLGRRSAVQPCSRCRISPETDRPIESCPNCSCADWIIRLKRFVLEIKDDPFECALNDNHLVLQDEQVKHEERLMALEEQLQWAIQSGIRISESDRLAYLTRMEAQRATEYRTRLHNFKQDYPTADELFTWTLNSVHLKILADSAFASPERVMDRIRQMDSCSPWPHLVPSDFVNLWCRQISLNVDRWRFQLRDYPKPWLEITDLLVWGPLAGAERLADWKGQRTVCISPGAPWPDHTVVKNCWPLKFFYDWNADLKEIRMCYGANWEPTVAWVSQRLEDILPQQTDMSLPRLGWWDRVRHLLHGRIYVVSDTMHWLCSTSLNPYNATEFFAWQWNHSSVCWETGNFHIEGDLDILFHTASKYDGVCPILHLPRLEMNIQLDWLSLGDPLDHHSVRPCNTERLRRLGIMEHDSYRYFRGNRLAMRISCTVRPAVDATTTEQQPSCLFYTSVLKFADKLRMCLTKVARPIRRGRIFRHTPHRKPMFGRLLQSLEFSLNLPQLELSYWVSYAKRTGVHVTTGPVQLVAVLRHTIELESKASFIPRRAIVLQPHVMLPPTNVGTVPGALIHRLQTNWAVVHLSSSLQDSRIQLRHRPDLPGQVVQMLLQSAGLLKEDAKTADTPGRTGSTDLSEEFILVPLLHYEQVAPTPLPPDASVRVHIPGRRVPNTANHNNSSNSVGPRGSSTQKASEMAKKSGANDAAIPGLEPDPPESILTNDASQLTHESLTPTHRLEVSDMKLRWTERTRDLIYMLMDTYQHAQSLKRNLSARATQAFQLEANPSSARVKSRDAVRSGPPGMHSRVASIGSNFTSRSTEPTTLDSTSACPVQSNLYCQADQVSSIAATMFPGNATGSVDLTDNNNQHRLGGSPQQSEVPTQSDRSWLPGLGRVPMLAQLLDEVDTVRFYAYCEEEPKQTDVMGQLQGLNICDQSPVTARNWHVELINSQLLLKTSSLAGYVLVTAARAKLNALAHPPIWRDAQLLTKSSLVGHLEGMQYFATVSQLSPGASDQWLPTADVSDWVHLNPSADEDALSGRPEVVGCGRSVGGVVNACVTSQTAPVTMTRAPSTHKHTSPVVFFDTKTPVSRGHSGLLISPKPVQLQRMISRCSCQVFYVHYEPADPVKLPAPHLIPPLPLDENDVVRTAEGADTVTILHHTLNICTNSPQYHMIVDIVNDLLLYVEPQRKAQTERNRVALGLMSESQVRTAILRDQECLRQFVAEQRYVERYLWTVARQVMSSIEVSLSQSGLFSRPGADPAIDQSEVSGSGRTKAPDSVLGHPFRMSIQYVQRLEAQVTQIKTRIVEQNTLLSQRLAYYQQLQVKAQRRHMQVAMKKRPMAAGGTRATASSLALLSVSASSACLLKQQKKADDHTPLSPVLASGVSTESQSRLTVLDGYSEGDITSPVEFNSSGGLTTEEQQQQAVTSAPSTSATGVSSAPAAPRRQRSLSKLEAPPASVVRRSEVCFEHAKWRMTESDGQIGLADVELRGFLYAKTHCQDDSGSHWLELGWIRVSNLVPDCFQKEVLAPDVTCGHYAGGPILRIACSELTPVGGISVKGAMEISVAPMSLQISKQFYRVMMPFFFPEKSDEPPVTGPPSMQQPISVLCEDTTGDHGSPIHRPNSDSTSLPNPPVPDQTDNGQKPLGSRIRRRFYPPANFIRHLYRLQPSGTGRPVSDTEFTMDSHPPAYSSSFHNTAVQPVGPSGVELVESSPPSCNLTVEAALAGKTNCNASIDVVGVVDSFPGVPELNRMSHALLHPEDLNPSSNTPFAVPSQTTAPQSSALSNTTLFRPLQSATADTNQSELWFLNPVQSSASTTAGLPMWPRSGVVQSHIGRHVTPGSSVHTGLLWSESNTTEGWVGAGASSGQSNADGSANPVEVMRERARRNNVFLYIKIPGFPICLSYKGEKQKNLTDVTGFQLNIPTLEYHNCVWTWLDFVMEVKTRIRKQLIREVIKKKFTPRRRIPLIHFGRSHSDRAMITSRSRNDAADAQSSSNYLQASDVSSTTGNAQGATETNTGPTTVAQEQRVQREVEMLLGRHAQPQPSQSGKWRRLRPHRL